MTDTKDDTDENYYFGKYEKIEVDLEASLYALNSPVGPFGPIAPFPIGPFPT